MNDLVSSGCKWKRRDDDASGCMRRGRSEVPTGFFSMFEIGEAGEAK